MAANYRRFTVGPDPFDRTWDVLFQWQQTGISIRHADTVDVKFRLSTGPRTEEKVIAFPHPDLLTLTKELGRPLTDAFCLKLAALHLQNMIKTDQDMEKVLVTVPLPVMRQLAKELASQAPAGASR